MSGRSRTEITVTEEALTPVMAERVLALATYTEENDGVAPLSEQALLRVRHVSTKPSYFFARIDTDDATELAGFLLLQPGGDEEADDLVAELVVRPDRRQRGVGRTLLAVALESAEAAGHRGTLRIWAHGDRPEAAALAEHLGFVRDRILLKMRRLTSLELPGVKIPDGVVIRTFRPGEDDEAWVALNAAAFAGHPEQAYVTLDDLRERQEEDWFDPAGFFLAARVSDGQLVGFHWTKVHARPHRVGEVYVIGLHPAARGSGLGLALTVTGLAHLASLGLAVVILYADETNAGAVRMYERLGFEVHHTDVEYARPLG